MRRIAHVIAFDDAPFDRAHRGDVLVVGVACSGTRIEGVLAGRVRRDGVNATRTLAALVEGSRFHGHTQAVLLQGIALAGFNVVDIHDLQRRLGIPVLVVARRAPDLRAMRAALLDRVPGGRRKWRLIERAGAMQPLHGVYVQAAGASLAVVGQVLARFTTHGKIPEPLRIAHLIAGGVTTGHSRGRA